MIQVPERKSPRSNFSGRALEAIDITKSFNSPSKVEVLKGVNLTLDRGETVAIMGKSGEGKSTLLHILGTLDTPTTGVLKIGNAPVPKKNLASIRNKHIGFIFQSYHLLEDFTVIDNIMMPMKISRQPIDSMRERAQMLLHEVGLTGKEQALAKHLSGGEKQRVAIARALSGDPDILFADEATGNLDRAHSQEIQNLLIHTAKKHQKALLVVTHDEEFAKQCDRHLLLKDGRLYNHAL